MTFSPFAVALGLGNIDVQSSLGEPLRATVKIEGSSQTIESGCFRLLRSSDQYAPTVLSTSMAIRHDSLGNTELLLRSRQALHDPIVQLTLVADCENQISREYVLLLDPPTTNNPQIDPTEFDSQLPSISADSNSAQVKPIVDDSAISKPQPQTISVPAAKPRRSVKANVPQVSRQASPDPSLTSLEGVEQPRLVLSAGEYIRPDFFDGPLQLQMSVELKDWPQDNVQPLSADEVSDEVTAMANRLAYLETQMTALQLRNQELESARVRALNQQNNTDTDWATKLVYSFVTLVVIGFIGIAEWLRRRSSQRQLDAEVAIWQVMTPQDELQDAASDSLMTETESEQSVSPSAKPSGSKSGALPQQATQAAFKTFDDDAGATVNEDILEQAEVFVAHGRANLAIVLLQDYLSEFPSSSPEPWLLLLDLLQRDNQAEAFAEAAAECKRYFNVAAGDFHQPFEHDHSSIEDYPQVKQQLEKIWGTSAVIPFLDDLIYNRRLNDVVFNRKIEARTGFKRNAYTEILFLRGLANGMHLTENSDSSAAAFNATMGDTIEDDVETFEQTVVLSAPVLTESTEDTTESEAAESIWGEPDVGTPEVETLAEPTTTEPEAPYLELFEPNQPDKRLPVDKSQPLDFEIEFRTDKK